MSETVKILIELLSEFELAYNLAATLCDNEKLLLKNKINEINEIIGNPYRDYD